MDRALVIWRGPFGWVVNCIVFTLAMAGAVALCYLGIVELSPSSLITYAVQVTSQKNTKQVVGEIKSSSQVAQKQANTIESQTKKVVDQTKQMADNLAAMQVQITELTKQATAMRKAAADLAQLRADFTRLQRTFQRSEAANDKLRAQQESILIEAIRKLDKDLAARGVQQ